MVSIMSEDDELLRELLSRAQSHEEEARSYDTQARFHHGEATRYNAAAAALSGDNVLPQASTTTSTERKINRRGSTNEMIVEILATEAATPGELAITMLANGWVTTSANPANTLRTALGRLQEREIVGQNSEGRWFKQVPSLGTPSQVSTG
jgi:hypothetical protein